VAVYPDTVDRLGCDVELVDEARAVRLCSWIDSAVAPGEPAQREG